MKLRSILFQSMAVAGLAFSIQSCSSDTTSTPTTNTNNSATLIGDSVAMGNGSAWSWTKLDSNGKPTAVGVTFTDEALNGLPDSMTATGMMGTNFKLPNKDGMSPFDHLTINWNPQGHPPEHVYDVPHFDFHFYTITPAEQMGIAGGADSTHIDSNYLPALYITDGQAVPMMGLHYLSALSPELQPPGSPNYAPFTHTFIYGFNQGTFIFSEPMITRAFLTSNANFTEAIPQPAKWQVENKYRPTSYTISYDAATKQHTVSLNGMTLK